jgi:hypothetical protein
MPLIAGVKKQAVGRESQLIQQSQCIQHQLLTLQRGVTSTTRHSENITCRGVMSTARHAALSHSFDYISTTLGEKVIGLLCMCSRRSWLSYGVGDSSYKLLLHFVLSSQSLGFLFAVLNFTGGFMGLWNYEMKYETNVIAINT